MKLSEQVPKLIIIAVMVGGFGIVASNLFGNGAGGATVSVTVPSLSLVALAGKTAFDANCAQCHGENGGGGTELGPPLVHEIYNPGHHGDDAFLIAARQGVRQHHWPYGNMPPQPDVTESRVLEIVRYVRELQEANGIAYRPHQM